MMKNSLGRTMHPDLASRFLARYERCRKSIEEEERVLSLFEHGQSDPVTDMEGIGEGRFAILDYLAPTRNAITDRLYKNYRLFEKMTVALAAAIRRIPEKSLRDYLVWHYFYRFTHEAVAEVMHYSVRQVYRQGSQARCALSKTLHLPPQSRPFKGRRYTVKAWHPRLPALRAAG